jgi:Arc/MetJ family transcription regulator
VEYAGAERGILEAISARPGIRFLYWDDAPSEIDLTTTRLGTVRVSGENVRQVLLPTTIETVLLSRPSADVEIVAPDDGAGLDLRMFPRHADVIIPPGLHRAAKLWLWVGGEVSASRLTTLTELESLRLSFDCGPGVISSRRGGLMTIIQIDLDDEALAQAMRLSSAMSREDTVNLALREYVRRHGRIAALDRYAASAQSWDHAAWRSIREAGKTN